MPGGRFAVFFIYVIGGDSPPGKVVYISSPLLLFLSPFCCRVVSRLDLQAKIYPGMTFLHPTTAFPR